MESIKTSIFCASMVQRGGDIRNTMPKHSGVDLVLIKKFRRCSCVGLLHNSGRELK